MAAPNDPPNASAGPLLAEVTNAIVRLYRTHYGKGPTRSKSYLVDDVLICVMRDVFTPVEYTLLAAAEQDQVRDNRLAVLDAVEDTFKEAVEDILQRPVLGFTSQVLVEQEMAIDVFLLGPATRAPRPPRPAG